jgi:hypothetical protein
MNSTLDNVRESVGTSKSRIDFAEAELELIELLEAIRRDDTILDLQKRSAEGILAAAIDALHERRKSPSALKAALLSVESEAESLDEGVGKALEAWHFYLIYRGHEVDPEAISVVRRLLRRRRGNADRNRRDLLRDLDRYEWLAENGVKPELSCDNLRGIAEATKVLELPPGAGDELTRRARSAGEIAKARGSLGKDALVKSSLTACREIVERAWREHQAAPQKFLDQTTSFCARVTLTDLPEIIAATPTLAEAADELNEQVDVLREQLDAVGYRSSSAVYATYQRQMRELDRAVSQSIDFARLLVAESDLLARVRTSARSGTEGRDKLFPFHTNQLVQELSELKRRIESKRGSVDQLNFELEFLESEIAVLESKDVEAPVGAVRRLRGEIGRDGMLDRWIGFFPVAAARRAGLEKLKDLRHRVAALWQKLQEAEPARVGRYRASAEALVTTISTTDDLPSLLADLADARRALHDFSPRAAATLRESVDAVYDAFRRRAQDVSALRARISALDEQIAALRRRRYGRIDFDELFTMAGSCKRWLRLRDFPQSERAALSQALRRATGKIYELQSRQKRLIEERELRSAELAEELEADIRAGVENALAAPGARANWDELVQLRHRLGDAWTLLQEAKRDRLRDALNEGFSSIRQLRTEFAIEAERNFSTLHEELMDVLSRLEEEASRDAAFEAIESLKVLRPRIREERVLTKAQRAELQGELGIISQGVDEIFETENARSADQNAALTASVESLAGQIGGARSWQEALNLTRLHKEASGALRNASLSIRHRKQLRLRLDELWEDISEKLQKYRFGRGDGEQPDDLLRRLEQQNWVVFVSGIPRAA